MNIERNIIQFMLECLRNEIIIASWGISNIHISELQVSFYVEGYNYKGMIIVSSHKDYIVLNTSKEYIGKAKNSKEVIRLLDKYIEANDEKYKKLYRKIISEKSLNNL